MPHELLLLIPLSFAAGLINATVGGGGLVIIPGMFAVLPRMLPAAIFGTDKFAAVMGHAFAARQYAMQLDIPWRLVIMAAIAAFIGSYFGARAIAYLPVNWVRPGVIGLLVVMLVYTWRKPSFGTLDQSKPIAARELAIGLLIGMAIGFYDGFFGPGTGSFLIFLFIRLFHFDFLRASACAKVVNMATNLAALCFFVPAGYVVYQLAIPMGIAAMAGAWLGARLALRGGNQWVRRLFIVLAITLLAKLIFDTVRTL